MSAYYFDASAVVKRYIDEPGSAWVRQVCLARDQNALENFNYIAIGEITVAEVAAAFAVLVRRNVIPKRIGTRAYEKFISEFRDEYEIVQLTPTLILAAAQLTQRYPLKAYDALQLALAMRANDLLKANGLALIFVAGDTPLLQAARAENLITENPFDHTDLD
jgi:predicted nucleic acid-binding protein